MQLNNETISVFLYAADPFLAEGLRAILGRIGELRLTDDPDNADVAVIAGHRLDDELQRTVGAVQRNGRPQVVALVAEVDDDELLEGAAAGIAAVVRRSAGAEALVAAILAGARGEATFPPDLIAKLLSRVAAGRRGGSFVLDAPPPNRLHEREVEVLRLLADGLDTGEIATRLCYSERTIKGIVHDLTSRLHLKNRSHAVAYAMKAGLI